MCAWNLRIQDTVYCFTSVKHICLHEIKAVIKSKAEAEDPQDCFDIGGERRKK